PEDGASGRQQFTAVFGMRFARIRMRSGKTLGQTEVENLYDTLGPDLDVSGFQIAMNDALRVCRRERCCNLARNLQGFGDRGRSTLQLPGECGTFDEFHHQVTGNLRREADVAA